VGGLKKKKKEKKKRRRRRRREEKEKEEEEALATIRKRIPVPQYQPISAPIKVGNSTKA